MLKLRKDVNSQKAQFIYETFLNYLPKIFKVKFYHFKNQNGRKLLNYVLFFIIHK